MFQYWTEDTPAARVYSFHLVWLFYEAMQGGADVNELFHAVRHADRSVPETVTTDRGFLGSSV